MVDMRPGPEDTSERRLSNTWEHVPIRSYKSRDEYLFAMKEDLAEWLDNLYSIDIQPENFVEKLETGIVLCQHANSIKKQAVAWKDIQLTNKNGCSDQIRIPSEEVKYRGNAQPGTFVARDNISNFIYWCRHSLGVHDVLLFETDDLVMRKNIRSFILCLLEVARKGARFGMLVPMLIQLEQEIDREIASEVNGESSDAADDADVESEPEQEPKPRQVRQEPPPKPRVLMTKQDLMSLDEMVRDLVSRCTCPNQFPMIRVAEGKYRIGDSKTKIYVRILRNHVMVRVGGGWDTLEHYLDKHDPCRCLGHRSHNLYHKTTKSAPGTDRPKPSLGDRRASTAESPVRRRPSLHHTEMNRPRSAVEPSMSKKENSSLEHIPKSTSSPGNLQKPSVTRSPSRRLSEIKKAQLTATLSDSGTRRTNNLSTPESSCMSNSPSSSPIPIRRPRPGSFCSHSASNSPVMQRRHGSVESASPLTKNHDGRSSLVRHPSIKKRSESPGISRSSTWRRSFNSGSSSTTSTPSLSRHNSDLNGSKLSSSSNRRHLDRDKNSTSDPAFGRSHSMREKKTTPVTATSEYLKQFRKKNQISRSRSSDPDRRVASCPTSPEQNNTTTSSFSSNAKLRSVSSTSRLARPESRNAIEIYGTLGRRPRSAGAGRERSESPATKLKDQLNISSPRVLRRARPASAKATVGRNSSSGNLKDKSTIMISRGDDGRHRLDSTSSSESLDSRSERSEMDDLLQAITSRWGSDNSKLDDDEVKLRPSNKTRASASGSTSSSARSSLDMENYNYQNYAGGSKAALARANQRSRPISRSKPSDRPRLTPKAKPQTKDESVKRMQREETRSRSIGSPKSPRKTLDTSGTRSRQIGGRGSGTVRSRSCHTEPDTLTNGMPIPRSRYLSDRDSNHLSSSVESDSSLSRIKPCFPIPQHLKIEARLHTPLRKELISSDRPTKIPLPVHHQSNVVFLRSNKPTARRNGRCFSMPDLEDRIEHSMNMPKIIKAQPRPTERDYSFSSIDSVSPTQHDSGYEDGRNDGTSKSLAARGVTESHL
ncbi:GAS2-like protein 2 isoform X2 [Anneissia japonica]|uniref:GAS2-like protein 2 isoform X2 n=1 Tax=Anneissia japonica TaxID=1529436 RepID=UPI0014258E13|nr:GAS2-like protein 2 isoform X2 [Anneissia japonica]